LQAKLTGREVEALAANRQQSGSLRSLLRGEYEFHQAESSLAADAYDRADAFYRRALARDPNFAEAAAELARTRLSRHWFVSPLAPAELEEVKSLIDRALALAPNSPERTLRWDYFFIGVTANTRTRWQSSTARWNCNLTTPTRGRIALGFIAGAVNGNARWPILNERRNSTRVTPASRPILE